MTADYPRLLALLTELLQLEAEEAELPLAIIVKLHKGQLRAPLQLLGLHAAQGTDTPFEAVARLQDHLSETYPLLIQQLPVVGQQPRLSQLRYRVNHRFPHGHPDELIHWLCEKAKGHYADYSSYEVPVQLYQLTHAEEEELALRAEILELELTLSPAAERIVLETRQLAGAPRPHWL
jgi:hypothetical protein